MRPSAVEPGAVLSPTRLRGELLLSNVETASDQLPAWTIRNVGSTGLPDIVCHPGSVHSGSRREMQTDLRQFVNASTRHLDLAGKRMCQLFGRSRRLLRAVQNGGAGEVSRRFNLAAHMSAVL